MTLATLNLNAWCIINGQASTLLCHSTLFESGPIDCLVCEVGNDAAEFFFCGHKSTTTVPVSVHFLYGDYR